METVSKLHEDHAEVFGHRHEQFAEILGLLCLGAGQLNIGQLGDTVHQIRHLPREQLADLRIRGIRVFDSVMQKRRDERGVIKTLLSQNGGNRYRVRKIGFT